MNYKRELTISILMTKKRRKLFESDFLKFNFFIGQIIAFHLKLFAMKIISFVISLIKNDKKVKK